MEKVISATALARQLGDILGRIRFRRQSFIVERNGVVVARLVPAGTTEGGTVGKALEAWRAAADADAEFADALEQVGRADRVPKDPWAS